MTNLLLLLTFIACLSITGAWVAENPGQVTIYWFDNRIDTSLAVLVLIALIAAGLLAFGYVLVRHLMHAPGRFSQRRSLKQYRLAMTELTYSVAALAASDTASAQLHTRKAEKLLGTTPLTLLLSAQIARNQGDDAKTQMLLEKLLEHKETEYLAARSLSDVASKQDSFSKALGLAQRARSINPRERASLLSVISLHVKLGQWQEAIKALNESFRRAGMDRAQRRHLKGVILLAQGMVMHRDQRQDEALSHARAALAHLPDFAPAICFAAEIYAERGEEPKAIKLLLRAWNNAPSPQLAETLRSVASDMPAEKRRKIIARIDDSLLDTGMMWTCTSCSAATEKWAAHCPACGAFDSLT